MVPPAGEPLAPTFFEPDVAAHAQLLAVHGFNDHQTAFASFAAFAADRGVLVETYDQQGFGRNANWGYWPGRAVLVADLAARIEARHAARPDLPLYVLGESMGAAVAVVTLAEHPELPVAGVVLSAPAVWGGEAMNPFYRAVLWLAAHVAPGWRLTGEGLGVQASDDIEMLRALGRDPLFIKATRVDALAGLVGLMERARDDGPALVLPRLVLAGARDEVVPPEAIDSFVATLKPEACRYVRYEEGWHMLLRDLQRERVWRDVLGWIEAPAAFTGSPCGTASADAGS
ncbi:MAG: lysophospholipase [Geminicoccaceae bacterium]|nr:lysophospholipase [Geminicoccaceae bacterium]